MHLFCLPTSAASRCLVEARTSSPLSLFTFHGSVERTVTGNAFSSTSTLQQREAVPAAGSSTSRFQQGAALQLLKAAGLERLSASVVAMVLILQSSRSMTSELRQGHIPSSTTEPPKKNLNAQKAKKNPATILLIIIKTSRVKTKNH